MEVTGCRIPPYLPSLEWMRNPKAFAGMKAREYTRTLIASNSPGGMVLTVPVTGGASAAKRLQPYRLEISGHGDWTRIHLGAMDAAYGKEPYFQHFFPLIAPVIRQYPSRLADLNVSLLSAILDSLGFDAAVEDIRNFRASHPQRFESIRKQMMSKIDPRHSLIEPLFRLGPDTLFLITEG